jgi:hypothetical protein
MCAIVLVVGWDLVGCLIFWIVNLDSNMLSVRLFLLNQSYSHVVGRK